MSAAPRWSDEKLDEFHSDFKRFETKFDQHIDDEAFEQRQQQELYVAVFQKENIDENVPPGLLQLVSRISHNLESINIAQNKQKIFTSGAIAAAMVFWGIISGAGRTLFQWLSKL